MRHVGRITSVRFSGGVALVWLDVGAGEPVRCIGDSGPMGRALTAMFPECRAGAMTINPDALVGKLVAVEIDGLDLVVEIGPAEEH